MTPEIFEAEPNPLVALFESKKIRIFGSVEEPLFCAVDVASHIDDTNIDRVFKELLDENYACWQMMYLSVGDVRKTIFLTEIGLYRYLLKSKKKLAEPFQDYTYELLANERKKVVDAEKLALKIEATNCATLKKEEATTRTTCDAERKEKYDYMRAANIARDETRAVEAKIARIVAEKAALETARAREAGLIVEEDWDPALDNPHGPEGPDGSGEPDLSSEDYPTPSAEDLANEDRECEAERGRRLAEKHCQLREADQAEVEEIILAEAEERKELPNPFKEFFEQKQIRVVGSVYKPLFHSTDVAQYIHDKQSAKIFRDQIPERYIRWVLLVDGLGRIQNTRFLTETGLYRYLLQTECKKADNFQKYTYALLQTHRKQIVSDFRLAIKIQKERGEQLKTARAAARKVHKVVRIEYNRCITAANESRDKLRESKRKLEKLETEWARTAEKAGIERYWSPFTPPAIRG